MGIWTVFFVGAAASARSLSSMGGFVIVLLPYALRVVPATSIVAAKIFG